MKAVILAGGLGTRISEETITKPKPMIEIGGLPIIWHIMKTYAHYGITDFIICCGYKGYIIKEYFSNYFLHTTDVTFDFKSKMSKLSDSVTSFVLLRISFVFQGAQEVELPIELEVQHFWWCLP